MRLPVRLSAMAIVLGLSAPIASAGAAPSIGRIAGAPFVYVGGRVVDLLEVVDLSVGLGPGGKLDVKYGLNFLGLGKVESARLGLDGGRPRLWLEKNDAVGLFPFSLLAVPVGLVGRLTSQREFARIALAAAVDGSIGTETLKREAIARHHGQAAVTDAIRMWRHTRWGDSLPVGAEVHAGLAGARVMLKPLQAVDFALGLVGFDIDPWLAKTPF